MSEYIDILNLDILARVREEQPSDPVADEIGRYALDALWWLGRHNKGAIKGRGKVWESDPAYLLKVDGIKGSHWFTLVTHRQGRQRPLPGCVAELVHNDEYASPMAHIVTPTPTTEGIVIVEGLVNNKLHLSQIKPIVAEIAASRLISPSSIPMLLNNTESRPF